MRQGGSAEEAVEAAIMIMEDDPVYDAGRGSHLTSAGVVEMDAAMMEGAHLGIGAVGCVNDVANPIVLARALITHKHAFLVGPGASRFAVEQGIALCDQSRLVVPRELSQWQAAHGAATLGGARPGAKASDTVGAIAIDQTGHLVAGVSTGGTQFKLPGRVGDSPCPGCGYYADDTLGAAVSTGQGEAIMRVVLAKAAVDALAGGVHPSQAAQAAIDSMADRVGGEAGLIMLDAQGRVGYAFNTRRLARAWEQDGGLRCEVEPDA